MRSILVVSDLTHVSDEAIRAGGRLADRTGAALHVLHCAGLVGLPLREAHPLLETASPATLAETLGTQLRRAAARHADAATIHVDYRAVHAGVLDCARQVGADLIVLCAQASGPASFTMLAMAAASPILLVRDGLAPPFERVVVPLGNGDITSSTLRRACEWLQPLEACTPDVLPEMHVLHVSRRLGDWRGIGGRFEAEVGSVEREVRRMGGVFDRHVCWGAEAWPAIVAISRELEADLVILRPERRDTGDAERTWPAVVEKARCSVLLLPAADGPPRVPGADGAGAPLDVAVIAGRRGEDTEEVDADVDADADAALALVSG